MTSAAGGRPVRALRTQDIARHLGLAPSTLDYWIRLGLCEPTLLPARGQRYQRLWSVRDAVTVRVVKQLRANGMPLQRIRRAREELDRKWDLGMTEVVLLWDGDEVLALDSEGELMRLLEQSGQYAFREVLRSVSLPVAAWFTEAERLGDDIDVSYLNRRREERIERLNRAGSSEPSVALIRRYLNGRAGG